MDIYAPYQRVRYFADPTGELLGDKHWPVQNFYYYPPEKFIAVHRSRLVYLGAGECATLWRAVVATVAPKDFVFGKTEGCYAERVYDTFTDAQLLQLWENTMKAPYTGEDIRGACLHLGTKIKPIPTPVHLLRYDPTKPPIFTPISAPVNPKTYTQSTYIPTHHEKPVEGSKTGKVWQVADLIAPKYPHYTKKQLKEEVIRECVRIGINPSTAQVQFGKWYSTEEAKKL